MSVEDLEFTPDALASTTVQPGLGAPRSIASASHPPERSGWRRIVVAGASTTIVEALGTALSGQPGLEVLSTAMSEPDMFELIARRRPDAVVLYVPKLNTETIKVVDQLKEHDPELRVVMLTGQPSVQALAQAAEAGAAACLSLNAHLRDLAEAIRADTTDTMLVDATSLSAPAEAQQVDLREEGATTLTRRELEVLAMLVDGCSPPAIAAELVISINTARGHVKSVLRKLGAHSQLEAVAVARRLSLVGSGAVTSGKTFERDGPASSARSRGPYYSRSLQRDRYGQSSPHP